MNPYPKISVVTPSYNQGDFLETTIRSVLDQNYPNLEYIIIDGGSTDQSVEIIKKFDNKLSYWVSEKDKGLYDGVQKGFDRSTGDIMCWINSDDILHKNSLFAVAEIFTTFKEVNWLVGAANYIDEKDRLVFASRAENWSRLRFLSGDFKYIHQESSFWTRTLWEKSGGYIDNSLQLAGDMELWLRFFRFEKCYCTFALLGSHRSRSGNQKSLDQKEEYDNEATELLKKEVKSLDRETKRQLDMINVYKSTIMSLPILKGTFQAKYYFDNMMHYPPQIELDRMTQLFVLKRHTH